jgi:hypothetical protein
MLDALGLVVIRRGVELLRLFQPWCKWSFFLCMVSIKLPGLWRVNDPSECTDTLGGAWFGQNPPGIRIVMTIPTTV